MPSRIEGIRSWCKRILLAELFESMFSGTGELEDRGSLLIYRDRVNGTLIYWYGAPRRGGIARGHGGRRIRQGSKTEPAPPRRWRSRPQADEWEIMRRHPVWGAEILAQGDGFEVARRIARWHHENIDGSGYPDGLRGERIPLEARIVRIADAFDAMTHPRPFQAARSVEWALEELARYAGSQFDPELAALFIDRVRNDGGLRERLLAHRVAHGSLDLRAS